MKKHWTQFPRAVIFCDTSGFSRQWSPRTMGKWRRFGAIISVMTFYVANKHIHYSQTATLAMQREESTKGQ